jgi:hypothetical protein
LKKVKQLRKVSGREEHKRIKECQQVTTGKRKSMKVNMTKKIKRLKESRNVQKDQIAEKSDKM